jgi:hypothetical protein
LLSRKLALRFLAAQAIGQARKRQTILSTKWILQTNMLPTPPRNNGE